jgi:uncharacterized protein YndB with AHSA1/START domain
MSQKITVQVVVHAPLEQVWKCWTEPKHITQWNAASPDWHTPRAENDLRVGGTFSSRMEAKDQSRGFDFCGTYTEVILQEKIAYVLGDERKVEILFQQTSEGARVVETFDSEEENSADMQRNGWQAILNEFKKYTEKEQSAS